MSVTNETELSIIHETSIFEASCFFHINIDFFIICKEQYITKYINNAFYFYLISTVF